MSGVYRERLPALAPDAAELVLLHGWGSHSDIWRSLAPRLRQDFNLTLIDLPLAAGEGMLEQLLPALPERAIYLGWSLGGMLAAQLAARFPQRVAALITVAANIRFVAGGDWSDAMPGKTFAGFRTLVESQPDKARQRFDLLQCYGDANRQPLLEKLEYIAAGNARYDSVALLAGLEALQQWDNSEVMAKIQCPVLQLFGEADALVPVSAATAIGRRFPRHQVITMSDCGHLPFLSKSEVFIDHCREFLQRADLLVAAERSAGDQRQAIRNFKRDVARSFSRAASSYDSVASLQREVADSQLAALPDICGRAVLDLGCGTGYCLPALRQGLAGGRLIALDLAEGMLHYAAARHPEAQVDQWVCGDAENLPLADACVDLVFSSFSLQWCDNLQALYSELERVLRPGGRAFISTIGPDSLHELRTAWRSVDDFVHVNEFACRERLAAAIEHSGLHCESWRETRKQLYYRSLSELTRELKSLGAHNVNDGRPEGLTGRRRLRQLTEAYEGFRDGQGRLPASYQIWYLQLRKTHA